MIPDGSRRLFWPGSPRSAPPLEKVLRVLLSVEIPSVIAVPCEPASGAKSSWPLSLTDAIQIILGTERSAQHDSKWSIFSTEDCVHPICFLVSHELNRVGHDLSKLEPALAMRGATAKPTYVAEKKRRAELTAGELANLRKVMLPIKTEQVELCDFVTGVESFLSEFVCYWPCDSEKDRRRKSSLTQSFDSWTRRTAIGRHFCQPYLQNEGAF